MVSALMVCAGLLAFAGESQGNLSPLQAYRETEAASGQSAEAQIKLALWCEAHGLTAERTKHLARAVLLDPKNATARGLMGLVANGARWSRPEALVESLKNDEALTAALAEYNAKREQTPETAEAQWKLALWCEQKGLKAESIAHLTAVTRLEPGRALAWKHLGYRLHAGRWMTPEQIRAETLETAAQESADRFWNPQLERIKGLLSFRDNGKRSSAEAQLAAIKDPRAVASVMKVFGSRSVASQRLAVQILGQIDHPASSKALAVLAADAASDNSRRAATESLRHRDPRDFIDRIIARLLDPIRYHVNPVSGPGSSGELLIEGDRYNVDRVYQAPPLPAIAVSPRSTFEFDKEGLLVINMAIAVPGTAMFNSLTPSLTSAMITRSLEPMIRSPLNTRTQGLTTSGRVTPQERAANGTLPQIIAAFLGPNSGLLAVPWILNPLDMWIASLDGVQTQAPIAPGSPIWSVNTGDAVAMPQRPIVVPIGKMIKEIHKTAYKARVQQRDDIRALERENAAIRKYNDRLIAALTSITGSTFGETQTAWERWLIDQRGYAYNARWAVSRPTYYEDVALEYQPNPVGRFQYDREIGYFTTPSAGSSCFAAGTTVRTLNGPRAIETIQLGDRVLAQNVVSGALNFEPVVSVHHNLPATTFRVAFDSETILSTGIHRFWKAHKGWVMARDLKPGDLVRTLTGIATVRSVETESTRPVFNLEIAGEHNFFVGSTGALVHDHSLVAPVETPFDALSSNSTAADFR